MKWCCLFFCCIFVIFLGGLSIAFATPIHDHKGSGDGFAFDAVSFDNCNRHFFGESEIDYFAGFPGESGIGKSKFQNPLGDMEESQGFSNPVPSTLFLLGTGLIGLAAFRRKRMVRP